MELKGHECIPANDGRNGLQLLENEKFDIVTLDIAMPEFSGFDVVDALDKDGKSENQNIIVLTAVPLSDEEEHQLKQKGVKAILRKPVNLRTLLETMHNLKE
jgi:DNA-binding response OmpR family regulator